MPYATPGTGRDAYEIGRGRSPGGSLGAGRLGLGLGLGRAGRQGFRDAANTGQLDTFLADKGLDRRFDRALDRPGARGDRAADFQRVNTAAPLAAPPTTMPAPVAAATNGKPGGASAGPPPATATPGTPAAPSFAQRLAQMFGEGNPFGSQAWYGENPLETASAVANRELGKNLGGIRERYGASGLGNSDRLALAEGTAMGESATGLGDVLAARGIGARDSDLNRQMTGLLSGEQLAQGRERMPIDALSQLLSSGFGLTDMQGLEQMTPLMQMILPYLTGYSPTESSGVQWGRFAAGS